MKRNTLIIFLLALCVYYALRQAESKRSLDYYRRKEAQRRQADEAEKRRQEAAFEEFAQGEREHYAGLDAIGKAERLSTWRRAGVSPEFFGIDWNDEGGE